MGFAKCTVTPYFVKLLPGRSYMFTLNQPCGHVVDFDDAFERRDHFACPLCGLRYHVEQAPATVTKTGFIMPGERKLVIDSQPNLPLFGVVGRK